MKKINGFAKPLKNLLVLLVIFIAYSCGEKDVSAPKPPVVTPTPDPTTVPGAKITKVTPTPTRVYTGDDLQLSVEAINTTGIYVDGQRITGDYYAFNNVVSSSNHLIKAMGLNGGANDSTTFAVLPPWSLNNKHLTKNAKMYMIYNVGVGTDTITHQVITRPGTIITDTLYYNPDGTGKKINQAGNFAGTLNWSFIANSNETQIGSSPNDPDFWNIDQLNSNILKKWQDKLDALTPQIKWRTTQIYQIVPVL